MSLPDQWATPEDFATLFQYFWHRDFPVGQGATSAKRSDWTMHIGMIVRNIADLMGLYARFESGHRKDAILQSGQGEEIAVGWEWNGVWGTELKNLTGHLTPRSDKRSERLLKYSVLISYTHTPNIEKVYDYIAQEWEGARWPLLLILIDLKESTKFFSRKEFGNLIMSVFDSDHRSKLRESPAFPWNVASSRWAFQKYEPNFS